MFIHSSGKRNKTSSLKTRLVGNFLALVVGIIVIFMITICIALFIEKKNYIIEDLNFQDHHSLQLIEQKLCFFIESVDNFCGNHFIINSIIHSQSKWQYLPKLVEDFCRFQYVVSVTIVDYQGKVIHSSLKNPPDYNKILYLRHTLVSGQKIVTVKKSSKNLIIVDSVDYYDSPIGAVIVEIEFDKLVSNILLNAPSTYHKLYAGKQLIFSTKQDDNLKYMVHENIAQQDLTNLYSLNIRLESGALQSIYINTILRVISPVLFLGILFVIISILIAIKLSRDIAIPIIELCKKAAQSDDLHINKYSPVGTNDELEELAKVLDKREMELKKVQEHLIKAKIEAENANKEKSKFLANMSHEIRTPMNAIIGLTSLVTRTNLTAKQNDYITNIQVASQNLLGIINDILDFSKIEAGKLELDLKSFNLEQLLSNISNQLSVKAEEKGLELVLFINANLYINLIGDSIKIGQILINLISNAIKFSDHGEIVLRTEMKTDNNIEDDLVTLSFSIEDKGIGMTQDQLNKLFKPFIQADASTTRKYVGTGLGLTISKRLIKMMEGDIHVESEPGKGSKFSFYIKVNKNSESPLNLLELSNDLKHTKALVVDDNQIACDALACILESFSFRVTKAYSGKEAIKRLEDVKNKKNPFKLILMDYKMPDLDGIQTSKIIKNMSNLPVIPKILMITAYDREDIKQQAKKIGINEYITKPVYPSVLFDNIMNVFASTTIHKRIISHDLSDISKDLNDIRGARILLAEDDEINQLVAIDLLEYEGFFVHTVDNGIEAVKELEINHYDVVIMDIQMPKLDGYKASEAIRKLKSEMRNVPIIAMTAHAFKGEREKCLSFGMNDYVSKPIDQKELFLSLIKWIEPKERKLPENEKTKSDINSNIDFPNLEGLDTEAALNKMFRKKEFYKKILYQFLDNYNNIADQIVENYKNGNIKKCRELSHKVKGVTGNIGAFNLHETTKKLEMIFIKKDFENYSSIMDKFKDELSIVLQSITKLKEADSIEKDKNAKNISNENIKIDKSKVNNLLNELKELINLGDSKAETLFDELKAHLKGAGFDDYLSQIESHLHMFDMDEAQKILTNLTKAWEDSINA